MQPSLTHALAISYSNAPIANTLLLSTPRARCPRSNDKYNGSNTITSSLSLRMSWMILAITCGSPNAGASRLIQGLRTVCPSLGRWRGQEGDWRMATEIYHLFH